MSINSVFLAGNLTREPELKTTAGGMAILEFGLAVNERVKADGEWVDRPNFFDCTMFGTRAEAVSKFLSKGSKIAVAGHLRWHQWEKDGQKRSKIDVIVDNVESMSGRREQAAEQVAEPAAMVQSVMPGANIHYEDIPF